jgi:hypothetical protein
MNDDELITIVREQRDKVPMTTPVEQVISRGRAVRARRRIPGMAGALAVTALVPSGHHPAAHAQLTAWTVTKQADGKIDITISELRNPAGLQARLRADGLPATVSFSGPPNPAFKPYSPPRPSSGRSASSTRTAGPTIWSSTPQPCPAAPVCPSVSSPACRPASTGPARRYPSAWSTPARSAPPAKPPG